MEIIARRHQEDIDMVELFMVPEWDTEGKYLACVIHRDLLDKNVDDALNDGDVELILTMITDPSIIDDDAA
jgi:hypothetical protein